MSSDSTKKQRDRRHSGAIFDSTWDQRLVAMETKLTQTTPINDSSYVASVEKWRPSFVQRFHKETERQKALRGDLR